MKAHLECAHKSNASLYVSNYIVSEKERTYMHLRWDKILKSSNQPRQSKASKAQKKPFIISEAHSSWVVFEYIVRWA